MYLGSCFMVIIYFMFSSIILWFFLQIQQMQYLLRGILILYSLKINLLVYTLSLYNMGLVCKLTSIIGNSLLILYPVRLELSIPTILVVKPILLEYESIMLYELLMILLNICSLFIFINVYILSSEYSFYLIASSY